jgi:membrane fusion protein, multidrug efflux system
MKLFNSKNTSTKFPLWGGQTFLLGGFIFLLLLSCSKPDKKTELADLKSQQKEIETKIKTLEKELGTGKKVEATPINVTVSAVEPQNFKHFVEAQGVVTSKNIVMVTPQMGGAITGLFLTEGQMIKKGQLVATIDNSVMKESLIEIKTQLELATTVFNKQKALWDQQIGTEIQYLQAKANKESLEKRINTMDTQMGMSKVYAPISGTVEKVMQKSGEMGMPGAPMAQIVNVSDLKIVAHIGDTYVGSVKKGDAITVKFPDINKEFTTRISLVNALIDPASRTFGIEANIPNLGGSLKPNQVAIININDLSKGNSLIVSQNVVQKTEGGDLVYVAVTEGGKKIAKAKKVKTGISYNGNIEIIEGLTSGEMVITQGYQDLVDGTLINY